MADPKIKPVEAPKPKRKARAPADPNETKRAKFLRLARRRIPKAVKAIEQVANLFRPTQYDCDRAALDGTIALFRKCVEKMIDNFVGSAKVETSTLPFLTDAAPPNNGPAQ